jgi:Mn-containing catalase
MYFHDRRLQFPVRVEKPDPRFARALQQAIGGVEGEIRVCLQYFFQAWGTASRGPAKYKDLLLNTATEEIGHIEMLATAVALNLEGAPLNEKEDAAKDLVGASVMNGMDMRHILSAGLAALPSDANGVPFDCSHIYASGNLAADMYANIAAESSGRVLATRLYNMTDDAGMKEMLSFLIARDTMHQNQYLAVIEDLGGVSAQLPIPNSFPQSKEVQDYNYAFVTNNVSGEPPMEGRWTSGPSIDGHGEFHVKQMVSEGDQVPVLKPSPPMGGGQVEHSADSPHGLVQQGMQIAKDILS